MDISQEDNFSRVRPARVKEKIEHKTVRKSRKYCDSCSNGLIIKPRFSLYFRPERSRREIIPLGKWEILPDQIKYEEELGRGAFGVVRKATFTKRVGIKVFDTGKQILQDPKKAHQIVAVKVLQGKF